MNKFIAFLLFLSACSSCANSTNNSPRYLNTPIPGGYYFNEFTSDRERMAKFRGVTYQVKRWCKNVTDQTEGGGTGSGVNIGKGRIATAEHVVTIPENSECKYYIRNENIKDWFEVKLLIADNASDVAVLYANIDLGPGVLLETDPYLGQLIYCVGYPSLVVVGETHLSITQGLIASMGVGGHYRITASLYMGSSGGPVFTTDGRLVALVNSAAVGPFGLIYEGHYFVVPSAQINILLQKL